jgi:FlaG/FlaF family flagellin (archaellin)
MDSLKALVAIGVGLAGTVAMWLLGILSERLRLARLTARDDYDLPRGN